MPNQIKNQNNNKGGHRIFSRYEFMCGIPKVSLFNAQLDTIAPVNGKRSIIKYYLISNMNININISSHLSTIMCVCVRHKMYVCV